MNKDIVRNSSQGYQLNTDFQTTKEEEWPPNKQQPSGENEKC